MITIKVYTNLGAGPKYEIATPSVPREGEQMLFPGYKKERVEFVEYAMNEELTEVNRIYVWTKPIK